MTKTLEETRAEFIEKIGLMAQGEGLPRIAGRLLGLLVWDGTAVSFGELAKQLQVSRGSISTASRILEERRMIKRVAKAGQRQDYFQLSDNPYAKMFEAIADGLDRAQDDIDETLNAIPAGQKEIKARVEAYGDFYKAMSKAVSIAAKDLM